MTTYRYEIDLYDPVLAWLRAMQIDVIRFEVPFFEHRPDIVALRNDGDHIISVELKLRAAKRAIHQAYVAQLFADESYVAMPYKAACHVSSGKYGGIGVVGVTDAGECVVLTCPSDVGCIDKGYHIAYVAGLREGWGLGSPPLRRQREMGKDESRD